MSNTIFLLGKFIILFAFAISASSCDNTPNKLKAVSVAHWGSEKTLIYMPLYVAINGKFFEKNGLDVYLKYSGNDDQVFATVASGSAQFGVSDPTFTAVSREKGGNGRVVASLVNAVTNWGVSSNLNAPNVTDAKQLNGMKITSFPEPSTTFTILSAIKNKYNLEKMRIIPIIFGGELAALKTGAADIAVLLEPQTSLAEANGYKVVWPLAKMYGPFLLTGVSTTDTIIAKDPHLVQSFVDALEEAILFIRSDQVGTVKLLAADFPDVPPQILSNAVARLVNDGAIPSSAIINLDAWKKTLQLRVEHGDLKSVDTAQKAVDNSFAEKAQDSRQPK